MVMGRKGQGTHSALRTESFLEAHVLMASTWP